MSLLKNNNTAVNTYDSALSSILFQLTTKSDLSEQYVRLFFIQYLSLRDAKLFSSYQSRNISTPSKLLTEIHLNQDQKVHFKSTLQKKCEGRKAFRGKLLYILSCIVFSKNPDLEGHSIEAEVPTHTVLHSAFSRS